MFCNKAIYTGKIAKVLETKSLGGPGLKKCDEDSRRWFEIRAKTQKKRICRKKEKTSRNETSRKRRKNNYHNSLVKIWQGGAEETAICRQPPAPAPTNLCFKTNLVETVKFFGEIRKGFSNEINKGKGGFVKRNSKKGMPRIDGYKDFASIENISMAAAVVLAADYDRLKVLLDEVPPTVNLRDWDPLVVTKLNQLGYFRLLGHQPDPKLLIQNGDFLLMRILRSKDCSTLEKVDDALMKLGEFISKSESFTDAIVTHTLSIISEVMSNVTQHAYRDNEKFRYAHLSSFWVSAEANRSDKTLRIVLYDQGSTIPVTYPKMARTAKVARYLRRVLRQTPKFDYENDGTYIRAALRHGGSRTEKDYRGKGFPQMIQLLDVLGGGELMVLSRGGWCIRSSNGKITSGGYSCSIGGTLVEWNIEL